MIFKLLQRFFAFLSDRIFPKGQNIMLKIRPRFSRFSIVFLTYISIVPWNTCQSYHSIHFSSYGCELGNKTEFYISAKLREEEFQENPIINWDAILWVLRPPELWAVQFILAMVSLTEALLIAYLSYKVSSLNQSTQSTLVWDMTHSHIIIVLFSLCSFLPYSAW